MATHIITNPENIEDPELKSKIDLICNRMASSSIKNLNQVRIKNYNSDPIEFIFEFLTEQDAQNYLLEKQVLDNYPYEMNVIGKDYHEFRKIDDVKILFN